MVSWNHPSGNSISGYDTDCLIPGLASCCDVSRQVISLSGRNKIEETEWKEVWLRVEIWKGVWPGMEIHVGSHVSR